MVFDACGHIELRCSVRRMVDAIVRWNVRNFKGIDSFKAANVKAVESRIRSSLVVRINAADLTKIVFGGLGIELIKIEKMFPFDDLYSGQRN